VKALLPPRVQNRVRLFNSLRSAEPVDDSAGLLTTRLSGFEMGNWVTAVGQFCSGIIPENMTASQPHRIRTLDGWRGVAILLVIAGHGAHFGQYKDQLWPTLGLGVDIFFVLSGYIITSSLFRREKSPRPSTCATSTSGAPSAFFAGVRLPGTLCVVSLFVNLLDFHSSEVFGSLFFFRNYQLAATQRLYTTHFWSLSIEEHFYLLWPALFLWLGNRRSLWFAGIGACACATWRLYDCTHPTVGSDDICPARQFYRQIAPTRV